MTNSSFLYSILNERLNESPQRRISFAEYLDLVLYDPQYGYYSSNQVKIGAQGDFFTSSSLGADFGELLAEQLAEMWVILERPNPFFCVEIGGGSGDFVVDILAYLSKTNLDFFKALNYLIIDPSKGLREQQKNTLHSKSNVAGKVSWKTWQEIPPNSLTGCVFSNELFDALPVHQVILKQRKLQEVFITLDQGKIQEIYDNISGEIRNYFELIGIDILVDNYPENYRTEVNLKALEVIATIANKLKKGYLLTIDYGYSAAKYYHPQRYQGTLQCYHQHRRHNNPYVNLGEQDITSHVNFTALEKQGEKVGLETVGFTQQALFLMSLGLGDRLAALSQTELNLKELLHRRDALQQLINPTGLGGFGILVQSRGLSTREKEQVLRGLASSSRPSI
jgi:SAM-dependent MidA family methyltransferase